MLHDQDAETKRSRDRTARRSDEAAPHRRPRDLSSTAVSAGCRAASEPARDHAPTPDPVSSRPHRSQPIPHRSARPAVSDRPARSRADHRVARRRRVSTAPDADDRRDWTRARSMSRRPTPGSRRPHTLVVPLRRTHPATVARRDRRARQTQPREPCCFAWPEPSPRGRAAQPAPVRPRQSRRSA
jgi:hypothetical protein